MKEVTLFSKDKELDMLASWSSLFSTCSGITSTAYVPRNLNTKEFLEKFKWHGTKETTKTPGQYE